MVRNPIERALGVWSAANYRNVMLPGLGVVTCGELCDALADLKAENKEQRERLIQFANAFDAGYAAAERALAERAAVKVKALEWREHKGDEFCYHHFDADAVGGSYTIEARANGKFDLWLPNQSVGETYLSIATANAAAQADYERRILSALTTEPAAPEAIAKGLLSDADAKAAKLGKFGHHPDPAIDFEIEVETLQARLIDAKGGISKPGTEPEAVAAVLEDIERAMTFRVGGDPSAVRAKQTLRDLEADAKQAGQPAAPEGRQDDDRIRREMDEILRKQSERDIPFVPSTRPSEQAVTEAMVRIRDYADKPHADRYVIRNMAEAALKAAMEAGR